VATHPNQLIENLFGSELEDFKKYGVYTCRFYKDGKWIEAVTDTRVPHGGGEAGSPYATPIYGHCRDNNEIWLPFLEKAYAKLHGTYEHLNGGSVAEALVDLTGGSSEKMLLTDPKIQSMVENGKLWTKLKKYMEWGYLVCCSMSIQGGRFEEEGAAGILTNHAYSVLYIKEVGPLKFLKVRNPWGRSEWRGDWSDNDSKWQDHPEVEAAMQDDTDAMFKIDAEDGTFWMVWEDFVIHFNKIYVCRIFEDELFQQYPVQGQWKGKSAAGAHKLLIDRDGDDSKNSNSDPPAAVDRKSGNVRMDGDAFWFNNPQYRIQVEEPCDVYVSLMQRDKRMAGSRGDNVSINFVVMRQKKTVQGRMWEQDPSEVVADASAANFSYNFPQREVSKGNISLSPKYNYIVVPHTLNKGYESSYTMRVWAQKPIILNPLPECFMTVLKGSWERSGSRDTAGGGLKKRTEYGLRDNNKWCQNPQYWLTLPHGASTSERVTVKLVLRRTDKTKMDKNGKPEARKDPGDYIGVVVTRVAGNDADNPRRKKKEAKTNPLGEPLPTKMSTLKISASSSRKRLQQSQAEMEEGEKELPSRQMVVDQTEWWQSSDYSSKEVGTTLLRLLNPEWMPNGLLITPNLIREGREGKYALEVHSDHPVNVVELPESRSQTIAGEWDERTACGSHLYPEWRRNPKYHLRLMTDRPAKVKICLTRPEREWKSVCQGDMVGCMIGFYLLVGPKPNRDATSVVHEGKPWTESAFVPLHTISTPRELHLDPLPNDECYTIMPAIFEPKHQGSFMLSVTTDVEFTFKEDATRKK
jgi:hypothetical protein